MTNILFKERLKNENFIFLEKLNDLKITKINKNHSIYFDVKDNKYLLHLNMDDNFLAVLYRRIPLKNKNGRIIKYNLKEVKTRYNSNINDVRMYIKIRNSEYGGYDFCYSKNIIYSHVDVRFFALCLYRDKFLKFSDDLYNDLNIEFYKRKRNKILNEIKFHEEKILQLNNELNDLS